MIHLVMKFSITVHFGFVQYFMHYSKMSLYNLVLYCCICTLYVS